MESPEKQEQIAGRLTSTESKRLALSIDYLQSIIDSPDITEDNLGTLTNVLSEISAMREVYITRLMHLYKRKYKL